MGDLRTLIRASKVHFGQCLQAALMYRSSLAIFIFSEAFAYAGFIAFWYGAATSNPTQSFYKPMALVLYFCLVSFHHGIQHHGSSREIGGDIRLGKLSYSIVRPFPFLLQAALRSIAFTLTYSILLAPLLVGALMFVPNLWNTLHAGILPDFYWQYPVALIIGLASGWLVRMIIGMLAFDMSQIWGPDTCFIALYYACSGSVFPVDLLPIWALSIIKWTPMYYMIGFPVLTIMGRVSGEQYQQQAAQGGIVLSITLLLVVVMWRRGIKRFEAIGI